MSDTETAVINAETYLMRTEHLVEILLERQDARNSTNAIRDSALTVTILFLLRDVRRELEKITDD